MGGDSGSSSDKDVVKLADGRAVVTLDRALVKVLQTEARASKTPLSALVNKALEQFIEDRRDYRDAMEAIRRSRGKPDVPAHVVLKNLAWTFDFSDEAARNLAELDKPVAERIGGFIRDRLLAAPDPRMASKGQRLKGRAVLWRWRCGDYRVVAEVDAAGRHVRFVRIAHRREVYENLGDL